jgi:hypothetical protein
VLGRDSQVRNGAALLCQSIKCSYPRAGACALVREPRARWSPLEGGVSPRARRTLLEGRLVGLLWWAAEALRRGLCRARTFCVMFEMFLCFVFFVGLKQDSPGFLGDPHGFLRHAPRVTRGPADRGHRVPRRPRPDAPRGQPRACRLTVVPYRRRAPGGPPVRPAPPYVRRSKCRCTTVVSLSSARRRRREPI